MVSTKIGTTTLKSNSRIPLNTKRICKKERSYQTGSSSMCSLLHRFTRKSYLSMGSPKIFNFWGERRHKSPNVASDILCDLVAERESSSSPCKKKCEILLQKPMKKRSAVILVNWGEILEKNFRLWLKQAEVWGFSKMSKMSMSNTLAKKPLVRSQDRGSCK